MTEGLNNSILFCVKDKRQKNSKSILGVIETSLSSWPIYFKVFSKFSIHIKYNNVQRVLKVDIITYGFDM